MPIVRSAADLQAVRTTVARLTGQTCAGPTLGYGNSVFLSFGDVIRPATPRLPAKYTWQVGTWGSYWELKRGRSVISNSKRPEDEQKQSLDVLSGKAVSAVLVAYPSLALRVRVGTYDFVVRPGRAGSDPEVPEWDLRTDEGRILTVWPKRRWTYPEPKADRRS